MIVRLALLLLLAPLLGGCAWQTVKGSVAGGECKVFERPEYVVLGKRPYDQNWIDGTIEGGVGACRWKRPAPRPASIDAVPARKVASAPAKRRGVVARLKERVKSIWPKPSAVAQIPPVDVPAAVVAAAPVPPPKPRSAIDDLLDPKGVAR